MTDESILEETWSILRSILGLQKKSTRVPKPKPLRPVSTDETDQLGAMLENYQTNQQIGKPGAMILDAPLSRARSEKQLMDDFDKEGVTQREGIPIQGSDLPPQTLTSRAIGQKR